MLIRPYLDEGLFFDPEVIEAMGIAFRRVCKELGIKEKDDPVNRIVARAVIEKAEEGLHNAGELTRAVMDEFRPRRPPN
jgi:hypothetical protein